MMVFWASKLLVMHLMISIFGKYRRYRAYLVSFKAPVDGRAITRYGLYVEKNLVWKINKENMI